MSFVLLWTISCKDNRFLDKLEMTEENKLEMTEENNLGMTEGNNLGMTGQYSYGGTSPRSMSSRRTSIQPLSPVPKAARTSSSE